MKQEFLDFIKALMKANPEVTKEKLTPNVQAYLDALTEVEESKTVLTDNGKKILAYMREHTEQQMWKAREIAMGLFISSRGVSGSMRKLATDGFIEKLNNDSPVIYTLTEKGKTIEIEE